LSEAPSIREAMYCQNQACKNETNDKRVVVVELISKMLKKVQGME
jgi:hypothetical protein